MSSILIKNLETIREAANLFVRQMNNNTVFAFNGEMGAGKTTFIRAVCEELGVEEIINSPTFAIVNEYTSKSAGLIYHFDFYRIKNIQEAVQIGVEDYFESGSLCFIEWSEKIEELLPENTVFIKIEEQKNGERLLKFNMSKRYPTALTIAGSDSGGCAGIQADIKTFSASGVFATSVITSVTAQNTLEVRAVEILSTEIIRQQLETVLDDIVIDAVKTGLLPSPEVVETVAATIDSYQLKTVIVDPVMIATSGARLASDAIAHSFRQELYKRATLITPNIPEAETLSGIKILSEKDFRNAAEILLKQGCQAVLIKGGHLLSDSSTDILFQPNKEPVSFHSPRCQTNNLHGTGCSFSSAIAANMALGQDLETAISSAKKYIASAIQHGKDVTTGKGYGPLNHFYNPQVLIAKY
ncbi:MAG: bifunctional hydroxymethylpyrimidine kinase/phosphomethylpyrimidine kinase [Dysgonamonadaceae bacterium]|jgi:hydroxymethylpyrimidine/phosphomethylpyrimidine kinase|nr:bifunctional hydroxymethylpyrimidine kinase/phosphomethylpyrimidine kinase [Dysgonamonadaceae bacterium]